jgi:hypothetical protein
MNAFVDSIVELERQIAAERGDFALFVLLEREDLPGRWDLVVSAPWLDDERGFVDYLVGYIKKMMGGEQLVALSRVVVAKPEDELVQAMTGAFSMKHGVWEIWNTEFFGLEIRHAYIITSQTLSSAV